MADYLALYVQWLAAVSAPFDVWLVGVASGWWAA